MLLRSKYRVRWIQVFLGLSFLKRGEMSPEMIVGMLPALYRHNKRLKNKRCYKIHLRSRICKINLGIRRTFSINSIAVKGAICLGTLLLLKR